MKNFCFKKIMSLLLCLMLLLGTFPVSAMAEEPVAPEIPPVQEPVPEQPPVEPAPKAPVDEPIPDEPADEPIPDGPVDEPIPDEPSPEAPVCTCETDDAAYHAPFCAVYERTWEECSCAVKCSEAEPNIFCEHCYFEGIELCSGEDEAADFSIPSGEGWYFLGNDLHVSGRLTAIPDFGSYPCHSIYVESVGELALSESVDYLVTNRGLVSGGIYNQRFDNEGTVTGGSFMNDVNNSGLIENGVFYDSLYIGGSGNMACGKFMPGAEISFFSQYPQKVIHCVNGVDTALPYGPTILEVLGPGQWFEGDNPVDPSEYLPLNYTQYSAAYEVYTLSAVLGTVSVDKNFARVGETVTVTVSPDEPYVLASLLVDGEDVTALVVDNSYSFPMHANNVAVKAEFSLPFGEGWNLSGFPGNYRLEVTGKLSQLPLIPGYEYSGISVQEGGELALSETVSLRVNNYGTISSGNFTANVTNRASLTGGSYSSIVDNMQGGNITGGVFSGGLYNFSDGIINGAKLLPGACFEAMGEGSAAFVHSVNGVETVMPYGENLLSILGSGTWYAGDTALGDTDTVPANYTEFAAVYKINTATTNGGSITTDKEYAKAGETVNVTVIPTAPYFVEAFFVEGLNITSQPVDNSYSFTMPEKNVSVVAHFALPSGEGWKLLGLGGSYNLSVSGKLTELPELGVSLNAIVLDSTAELALSETVATRITGAGSISSGTYTGYVSVSGSVTGSSFHGDLQCRGDVSNVTVLGTFHNYGAASGCTLSGYVYNHGSIENSKFLPGASLAYGANPVSVIHSVNGVETTMPYGENLLSLLGEGIWFAGDVPVTEDDTVPLVCTEFVRAYSVNTLVTPFADGGSISVDKSLAKPGDTVNISVETSAVYLNKGLSVADAENNPVSVNGNSFVMPASDVTVKLQLAKVLNKANVSLDETSFVYDGNEHKPQVTVSDEGKQLTENVDYTLSYLTEPCVNAGDHKVSVVFCGDYEGYAIFDFTIGKAEALLDVNALDLVYNGAAQKLVNTDSIEAGKLEFSLDGDAWSENIPRATDAGSYEVFVRFPGSDNYNSAETRLTAVIAPRAVTVTVKENQYKRYEGSEPELKYTVTDDVVLNGTLSREAGETVGSYAILQNTLTNENNPNYVITFVGADFVIKPMRIASVSDATTLPITYGEPLSASVITNNWKWIDGAQIPDVSGNFAAYYDDDYVNYDFSGVDGYNEETGRVEREFYVSVQKAHRNITGLTVKGTVYDGNPHPGYSGTPVAEGYEGEFEVSYTYPDGSTSSEIPVNAGLYAVYISIPENDPHYHGIIGFYFEIGKADPVVTAPKAVEDLVYSGSAQPLVTAGSCNAGQLEYSLDGESWSKTLPSGTDAGEYEVLYRFRGTGNYEAFEEKSVKVSIAPFAVTVTVDADQSKVFSQDDPELKFTTNTLPADDELGVKLSREEGENVGFYNYKLDTTNANPNYSITLSDSTEQFEITPFEINDENTQLSTPDVNYTGSAVSPVVTISGSAGSLLKEADYTLSGNSGTAVGSYSLKLEAKGNYVGSVEAEWNILPPAILDDVLDGTLTPENVTDDQYDDILKVIQAINSADEEERENWADELEALKPIVDELEKRAEELVDELSKEIEEMMKEASADELEMREEYKELVEEIENSPYKDILNEALSEKLEALGDKLFEYKIISGNGSSWVRGSNLTLDITANGDVSLFEHLEVDGKAVNEANYTLVSGSTIIKLKADYLKTLSTGKHTIKFVYTDGSSELGNFNVVYAWWYAPQTGDSSNLGLWLSAMFVSLMGCAAILPKFFRRKD